MRLGSFLRSVRGEVLAVAEVPLSGGNMVLRLTLKKLARSDEQFVVVSMNGALQYDIQWLAMKDVQLLSDELLRLKSLSEASGPARPQPISATYDPNADALTVRLAEAKIHESEEVRPDILLDFDADHRIVGLEILQASKNLPKDRRVDRQYQSSL